MKKFLVILVAVLLIQASLAGDHKKKKDSSSSEEEKKSKGKAKQIVVVPITTPAPVPTLVCPKCPEPNLVIIKEVTVCKGDNRKLQCPAGYGVFIREAFYGRRDLITCPSQQPGSTSCSASNAFSLLSSRCNGVQNCDVATAYTWFTDPCADTYKYLEINFSCEPQQQPQQSARILRSA